METCEGYIAEVHSHAPSRYDAAGLNFLIARLDGPNANGLKIQGKMHTYSHGQLYRFYGSMKNSKNPRYPEPFFAFNAFDAIIEDSNEGYTSYLCRHCPGIGPVLAGRIVEKFGRDTFEVILQEPLRLMEVEGITEKIAGKVVDYVQQNPFQGVHLSALYELFDGYKIPERVVLKLAKWFGSNAKEMVLAKPYMLADIPRVGWQTADNFALHVAKVDRKSQDRQEAAIMETMKRLILAKGDTYVQEPNLFSEATNILGFTPAHSSLNALMAKEWVTWGEGNQGIKWFALTEINNHEQSIVYHLNRIESHAHPLDAEIDTDGLNEGQVKAVELVVNHGVCVITGPPGSGKTHVITHILSSLEDAGVGPLAIHAPTGKAAKRADELLRQHIPYTNIETSTMHRALGAGFGSDEEAGVPQDDARPNRGRQGFTFRHGPGYPMNLAIATLDEAGMPDVETFAAYVAAVGNGSRLILVGDHNQLPPVGPGHPFRDIIEAGWPHVALEKIERNIGTVVTACSDVKDGRVPVPAPKIKLDEGLNWVHFECKDLNEIHDKIVEKYMGYQEAKKRAKPDHPFWGAVDPVWDFQVISPQKERPKGICCQSFNSTLSGLLNPNPPEGPEGEDEESDFRINDKVIRYEKNELCELLVPFTEEGDDWLSGEGGDRKVSLTWKGQQYYSDKTLVVNGDMGVVLDVVKVLGHYRAIVLFRNPDRLVSLPYNSCKLDQAYCTSTHKFQGSQAKVLFLPVHEGFFWDERKYRGLWCREMFYTALSRCSGFVVTAGPMQAITTAVSRRTVQQRRTLLARYLREYRERHPVGAPAGEHAGNQEHGWDESWVV